tara:strand:+ start:20925 stop:21974 length:1050 start_codon:yes stop_codon:yes gene_type:complete
VKNSKIKIKSLTFENRFFVSPMCQYSSNNGSPSSWHYHHLRNLIETGAGGLVIESTAVSKIGKITIRDLCMYRKTHMKKHKDLLNNLKKIRNIPIILQISHSGRKGSAEIPFVKKNTSLKNNLKWKTVAPSPISRHMNWPTPKELSIIEIKKIINEFKNSAKLAFMSGYDGVEIHMAHGYLVHQFCSPISNKRVDEYGNDKYKFAIDILKAVKKITPKNKVIGARVTATDHLKDGLKIKDAINFTNQLKKQGLNYVCVSSGGIIPITKMRQYRGFRIKFASIIKRDCKILTRTSGMINDEKTINKAFKKFKIDFVAIGRKLITDKFFLYNLKELSVKDNLIRQYKYCLK